MLKEIELAGLPTVCAIKMGFWMDESCGQACLDGIRISLRYY
jgi:hypothetical protein